MTLSEIEIAANRGGIATGNFNISHTLRFEIVPDFYRKVGEANPTWMQRAGTISVTTSTRLYDMPSDFRSMIGIYYQASNVGKPSELKYIGEDPLLVAFAEAAVTPTTPHGYYIVKRASDGKFRTVKLDAPSDNSYTLPYVYRSRLSFSDEQDDVELDGYIPEDYQQALIEGLRREIYLDRYEQGDMRYQVAAGRYLEIVEEAKNGAHDLARRNYAVYSR